DRSSQGWGFHDNLPGAAVTAFREGEGKLDKAKDSMLRDCDERARRNAFLYIASWRKDWDEVSFFESGEQDYLDLVDPVLQKLHFDTTTKTMAEFGCGAGRMTRSFAQRFHSVSAVDISAEMQSRARGYLQSFSNIHWALSNGEKISGIETSSVDFVFSYLVLQHLPTKEMVLSSINEMMRILRPEGVFLFQFNGSDRPTMNWRGRAISELLDRVSSVGFHSMSCRIASLVGIDPGMVGKTWRGAVLTSPEIAKAVRSGNGWPEEIRDEGTPLAWCCGHKLLADQ